MSAMVETPLRGKIYALSKDRLRGTVLLDDDFNGRRYVIIANETNGREALIKASPTGKLEKYTQVKILKVSQGTGLLVALDIEAG
jgi:hypothetical protein